MDKHAQELEKMISQREADELANQRARKRLSNASMVSAAAGADDNAQQPGMSERQNSNQKSSPRISKDRSDDKTSGSGLVLLKNKDGEVFSTSQVDESPLDSDGDGKRSLGSG